MMTSKPPAYNSLSSAAIALFLWGCSALIVSVPSVYGSTDQKIRETVSYLEAEDYTSALEILRSLESELLNPDKLNNLWASAYLGRGYQLLSVGELSAARDAFRDGRLYRQNDIRLWQGEAIAWFKDGRYTEAASLLEQAIGYDPQNADLYHLLGRACYAAGRMPEALDALQRALGLTESEEVALLLQKVQREWQVEREMEQEYRGHFQLSFVDDGPATSLAKDILSTLEDAYAELGAELNYYPEVIVPVLLYTRSDYTNVTGSPDWSGALYDGKIRLPLAGVELMNDQFAALLYHEYMHVLVHFLANRQAPVWLNEGLAEIAGRRFYTPPLQRKAGVSQDALLDWQTLSKPFAVLDTFGAALAYEQSYSLAQYMVDNYGWYKMTELLELLGKKGDWQGSVAVVYEDFGLDWPTILNEWRASLD